MDSVELLASHLFIHFVFFHFFAHLYSSHALNLLMVSFWRDWVGSIVVLVPHQLRKRRQTHLIMLKALIRVFRAIWHGADLSPIGFRAKSAMLLQLLVLLPLLSGEGGVWRPRSGCVQSGGYCRNLDIQKFLISLTETLIHLVNRGSLVCFLYLEAELLCSLVATVWGVSDHRWFFYLILPLLLINDLLGHLINLSFSLMRSTIDHLVSR